MQHTVSLKQNHELDVYKRQHPPAVHGPVSRAAKGRPYKTDFVAPRRGGLWPPER